MKNLKSLRKSKNLTQERLAALSGINRTTLSLYETGHQIPTVITAYKIAQALGCTLDELLLK